MMVIFRDKWACQGLRDRLLRINYCGRIVDDDHESRGVGGFSRLSFGCASAPVTGRRLQGLLG